MHAFFDPCYSPENYCENFWDELHLRAPQLFNREHALYILNVDKKLMNQLCDYLNLRNRICSWLANAYQELNNYSYLALLISPIHIDGRSVQYELAADAVLYGEKHRELPLKKAYFRWKEIQETTGAYISGIDSNEARFDLANEGFTYKDCFVIAPSHEAQHSETSLLVVLQKNDRDETLIPCPSCRSQNVQGNSYSSLGVRSWECKNLLCPDRSKYNRGKRYSFRGLLMQQAIDDELNEIPSESVRSWLRDVQVGRSRKQILDMILRHYSLHADTVHIFNWPAADCDAVGRKIVLHSEEEVQGEGRTVGDFYKGPFFSRYIVAPKSKGDGPITELGDESFKVICGDAYETLKGLPPSYFDAAVTSPPYYNARDYSKWDNIYCYLHDMYAIAMEVFRCLKDGSLFLYNIFDYFDNENSLAFSAMGQKRMILSSYTVDMFRRIGFRCNGNIAWDKGDIEGKRGFNAGNYSPYYQAPFNCWEHILIFEKPAPTAAEHQLSINFPAVLRAQPVIKMVRGKNTHGHTAPFPEEIPALITTKLQNGARILDPFGGSLTTGRVAERQGIDSLCIEKHEEYCALGLTMRRDDLKKRSAQQMELGL
jgi:DNA modification methylase